MATAQDQADQYGEEEEYGAGMDQDWWEHEHKGIEQYLCGMKKIAERQWERLTAEGERCYLEGEQAWRREDAREHELREDPG